MTKIVVQKGVYAKNEIADRVFDMVLPPRTGKKGMYVTVDGDALGFPGRNVRIMIESADMVKTVDGSPLENEAPAPAVQVVLADVEDDESIMIRMRKKFQTLDGMTLAAIQGHVRAIVVSGPPGVGKSFGIESVISSLDVMLKMGLIDEDSVDLDAKMELEKVASASALGLYQLLYEYRSPGSLLVLDDSDSVLFDEVCLNMLKAVTDSGKNRKLSWRTESRVLEDRGIPDSFEFEGSIIFVTNLDFENCRGRTGEHLKAIVSRCHYLDLGMSNAREKFLRCKQIVRDGMLARYKFDDTQANDILDYMEENMDKLREISLRAVTKAADLVRMDPDGWKDFANETMLKPKK